MGADHQQHELGGLKAPQQPVQSPANTKLSQSFSDCARSALPLGEESAHDWNGPRISQPREKGAGDEGQGWRLPRCQRHNHGTA